MSTHGAELVCPRAGPLRRARRGPGGADSGRDEGNRELPEAVRRAEISAPVLEADRGPDIDVDDTGRVVVDKRDFGRAALDSAGRAPRPTAVPDAARTDSIADGFEPLVGLCAVVLPSDDELEELAEAADAGRVVVGGIVRGTGFDREGSFAIFVLFMIIEEGGATGFFSSERLSAGGAGLSWASAVEIEDLDDGPGTPILRLAGDVCDIVVLRDAESAPAADGNTFCLIASIAPSSRASLGFCTLEPTRGIVLDVSLVSCLRAVGAASIA